MDFEKQILEAIGSPMSSLDVEAQQIVKWLAGWDRHTADGVCRMIEAARANALREHLQLTAEGYRQLHGDR